jgi:hypothetical protein
MREAVLALAPVRHPLQWVLDVANLAGGLLGFNGCHRVRRANWEVPRMHLIEAETESP